MQSIMAWSVPPHLIQDVFEYIRKYGYDPADVYEIRLPADFGGSGITFYTYNRDKSGVNILDKNRRPTFTGHIHANVEPYDHLMPAVVNAAEWRY